MRTPDEPADVDHVVVHVDPSCPFAWITYRWLAEVEAVSQIKLTVQLLSLAVVNEHRDLDDWYRTFNDNAWAPARIMAAVAEHHDNQGARDFYQAFGQQFHVQDGTADDVDRRQVAIDSLTSAGLPSHLGAAADSREYDNRLRIDSRATLDRLELDVGVPLIEIDGEIASGPVLTCTPRARQAAALYQAVRTLAKQPGFVRLERPRQGALQTT